MSRLHSRLVLSLCVSLVACTNNPASTDAGGNGNDATTPTNDAGRDAAPAIDVGPLPDTGPVVCAMNFAGCTTFEDHTADTAPVVVAISGFAYTHACIRIHTGQMVTLPGEGFHPLSGATCNATTTIPTAGATTATTFTFATAGRYGYHCANHGSDLGTGMAGLIVVE